MRREDERIFELSAELEKERLLYKKAKEFIDKKYTLEFLEKDIKRKEDNLLKVVTDRNASLKANKIA